MRGLAAGLVVMLLAVSCSPGESESADASAGSLVDPLPVPDWPAGLATSLLADPDAVAVVQCLAGRQLSAVVSSDGAAGVMNIGRLAGEDAWLNQAWWSDGSIETQQGRYDTEFAKDSWSLSSDDPYAIDPSEVRNLDTFLGLFDFDGTTEDFGYTEPFVPLVVTQPVEKPNQIRLEVQPFSPPQSTGSPQQQAMVYLLGSANLNPFVMDVWTDDDQTTVRRIRTQWGPPDRLSYREMQFVEPNEVLIGGRLRLPTCSATADLWSTATEPRVAFNPIDLTSIESGWLGPDTSWEQPQAVLRASVDETGRPYDIFWRYEGEFRRTPYATLAIPDGRLLVMDGNEVEVSPSFFAERSVEIAVSPDDIRPDGVHEITLARVEFAPADGGEPWIHGVWLGPTDAAVTSWQPFELAYVTDGGVGGLVPHSVLAIDEARTDDDLWVPSAPSMFAVYDLDGIPGPETVVFGIGGGDGEYPLSRGLDADGNIVVTVIWGLQAPWRLAIPDGTPPNDVTEAENDVAECIAGTREITEEGFCLIGS